MPLYTPPPPTTKYFYDTEFLDNGKTIELISIGIVAEDGREYYAVNANMDQYEVRTHEWLRDNVWIWLPIISDSSHLECCNGYYTEDLDLNDPTVKPRAQIAEEVRSFLLVGGVPPPELWSYFGAYDHVVLAQLWGPMSGLPRGIPMWTHDIMQYVENQFPEQYWPPPPEEHHNALADAKWHRDLYEAARRFINRPLGIGLPEEKP